jgi:riboflavin synthase
MFTGLVAGVGTVVGTTAGARDLELLVDLGDLAVGDSIGDSIALSGVCCTVTRLEGTVGAFTLTEETLRRTWLGDSTSGRLLNIEKPMRAGDPFGGHIVQGHVDGLGEVRTPIDPTAGGELVVEVPGDLARYCVEKGSIALDGISLTIAGLEDLPSGASEIMVAVIPHTAKATTCGSMVSGQPVHVEVDVLAKHVERLLAGRM